MVGGSPPPCAHPLAPSPLHGHRSWPFRLTSCRRSGGLTVVGLAPVYRVKRYRSSEKPPREGDCSRREAHGARPRARRRRARRPAGGPDPPPPVPEPDFPVPEPSLRRAGTVVFPCRTLPGRPATAARRSSSRHPRGGVSNRAWRVQSSPAARPAFERSVEPHRARRGVERERRGRDRGASEPRALSPGGVETPHALKVPVGSGFAVAIGRHESGSREAGARA